MEISNIDHTPKDCLVPGSADTGDRLVFRGCCWSGLLPGDLILRPVIPRRNPWLRWVDHLLNRLVPASLGHVMLYAGKGRVYNIRPDQQPVVSSEDIIENLNSFGAVRRHPGQLVFVRLTLSPGQRAAACRFLDRHAKQATRFKSVFPAHILDPGPPPLYDGFNCVTGIRLALRHAGFSIDHSFPVPLAHRSRLPRIRRPVARFFFTGYNFVVAAEKILEPAIVTRPNKGKPIPRR